MDVYVHSGVVMKKTQKPVDLLVSLLNSISVFLWVFLPMPFFLSRFVFFELYSLG